MARFEKEKNGITVFDVEAYIKKINMEDEARNAYLKSLDEELTQKGFYEIKQNFWGMIVRKSKINPKSQDVQFAVSYGLPDVRKWVRQYIDAVTMGDGDFLSNSSTCKHMVFLPPSLSLQNFSKCLCHPGGPQPFPLQEILM